MTAGRAPIRIGIDGRVLERKRTGVGRYVFELCKELDRVLPSHAQLLVYARRPVELPVASPRWRLRLERNAVAARLPASVWLKVRAPALIRDDALTAFWGTGSLLPSLADDVRAVVTVYDLNYLVVPDTMPRSTQLTHRAFFARDARRADAVVAISSGTAHRLQMLLGVAAAAIVRPAVASAFLEPLRENANDVRARLGVASPYFLAVGTREPRKNLPLLVDAFAAARQSGLPSDVVLVLTGAGGWREASLRRAIHALPPGSVHVLGYVSDAELAALYEGAIAFVFPSRYEGYGIPVLEARACGAVVIAADVPELREAGADDATYVQPTVQRLTDAMLAAARGELPAAREPVSRDGWRRGGETMAELLTAPPASVRRRAPAGGVARSPARST